MKILSIGNSFTQDSHKWLSPIAASRGDTITAVGLVIGGCTLETHWNHFSSNACEYAMEVNGCYIKQTTIADTLRSDNWDIITLQQASHHSGIFETYDPYLFDLAKGIKEICPQSKLYIHQTWAYETDCSYTLGFQNYNFSQSEMFEKLTAAYAKAADRLGCDIIPSGEVIQHLRRSLPEFDYQNGGLSLNRDGFHLTATYGRYAAALTWYGTLLNRDVTNVSFIPEDDAGNKADAALLKKINICVQEVLDKH